MSDKPPTETAKIVDAVCEASDYPGEAAERIAAGLGISFGEALALVKEREARADTAERGSFIVKQNGVTVASGSGPCEALQREAMHYGAIYAQDGPTEVIIRRLKPRKAKG